MASILIVDDDARAAGALAALLQQEHHDTRCATGAGDALKQLRHGEPDLILLDLSMPRVDGMELLEALGEEPQFAHIPVVVLSGRTEPDTIERARRLGATDFLAKGQSWETLYQRICACLPHESAA